jgi:hypothetical protein
MENTVLFDKDNPDHRRVLGIYLRANGINPAEQKQLCLDVAAMLHTCDMAVLEQATADAIEAHRAKAKATPPPVPTASPAPAMASWAPTIEDGGEGRGRIICLYGDSGIGKSTWAAQAQRCVFLDLEKGLEQIKCKKIPMTKTADLPRVLRWFFTSDYDTLVIDSISKLEKMVWDEMLQEHQVETMALVAGGFGKGFDIAADKFRKILDFMKASTQRTEKKVIIIGHAAAITAPNPAGEAFEKYTVDAHKKVVNHLLSTLDAVLFAQLDTVLKKKTDGYYQAISKDTVTVYTSFNGFCTCKNRFNLPKTHPLDTELLRKMGF